MIVVILFTYLFNFNLLFKENTVDYSYYKFKASQGYLFYLNKIISVNVKSSMLHPGYNLG